MTQKQDPGLVSCIRDLDLAQVLAGGSRLNGIGKDRNKVLVVGIYLADQANSITDLVATFADSARFDVTQRWVALGGEAPTPEAASVTAHVVRDRIPKYQILNDLLSQLDLTGYEYVITSDDDIQLPRPFLDHFLTVQTDRAFAIAGPARTSNSYLDHPIVEQQRGVLARQTLFVEIGPLASFHRSVYDLVFPFDLTSPMGWGYEHVWAHRLTQHGRKMGIIDALAVEHSMRKPVANYSWAEANDACMGYLANNTHLPHLECLRVLDVIGFEEAGVSPPVVQPFRREPPASVEAPALAGGSRRNGCTTGGAQVSVILPTWNRADLLDQSLHSLSAQSLPRHCFEVIVVDDGSTDGTAEVCRRWALELPLRSYCIRHAGKAAARNLGIFTATGSVLVFFDDDDVAHEDLLREHWECHQKHPAETVAVLGSTTWHASLRVTEVMRYITEVFFGYRSLKAGQALDFKHFWAGRSSCKRAFLVKHGVFCQGFDPSCADIELGYRLSRFGLRVIYHPRAVQYVNRSIMFEDFGRRCQKQGRARVWFARRHRAAEVQDYCDIPGATQRWREGEPQLAWKLRRIADLETLLRRMASTTCSDGSEDPSDRGSDLIAELYKLYGWAFRLLTARGIHEEIETQEQG